MNYDELRLSVRGMVLEPGAEGYEDARRVWNGRFDRRPAAIVRCVDAADVAQAVRFAGARDMDLGVKSGGHDYAGNSACDGGLVVDLSDMRTVQIDADLRRAVVEPGVIWRDFDAAAQEVNLATTGGACSTAGVAGVALGGGMGFLSRKQGLTCDNLLVAEVVTADGRQVVASEDENPDLLWALRGGGGNFGVVTSLVFQLYCVGPDVVAGPIVHRFEAAREALYFYREFMARAPDELQCYPCFLRVPPVEGLLEEQHGEVALYFVACFAGDAGDAEDALRPLRAFGEPLFDGVETLPYTVLQQSFEAGLPKGERYYTRAHYLDRLSDGAIDAVLAHAPGLRGAFSNAYFEPLGGAISRVGPEETAFPHREADLGFHLLTGWTDPADDASLMAWARDFHDAMAPYATGGVYVNLLGEDESERIEAAYGPNYARLARVKAKWDPGNLFRMNHNVVPRA